MYIQTGELHEVCLLQLEAHSCRSMLPVQVPASLAMFRAVSNYQTHSRDRDFGGILACVLPVHAVYLIWAGSYPASWSLGIVLKLTPSWLHSHKAAVFRGV